MAGTGPAMTTGSLLALHEVRPEHVEDSYVIVET